MMGKHGSVLKQQAPNPNEMSIKNQKTTHE